MTQLVVDSSVLVAALADLGPDGVWATSTLADKELAAPELVMFEATNTFRRLEISGAIGAQAALAAFAALTEMSLPLWPYAPLATRIWGLRGSVTGYDAAYVALAELLETPLVTLDHRLVRASGPRCHILVRE